MTTVRVLAGRYRLDGEIGRGSMGTVWNAYDEVLRRRVAIKEVNFPAGMAAAEAEQLADRTLREARAIAALSHPHVITLFDIVTTGGGPVIVMELMEARSLAEILADGGPLAPRDAAVIGQAVAAGLMAAHGAGITHRDVKPANVLISDDGRIKLTDFGIARAAGEQSLTATGLLLGSPAYISPEVASGRPATPTADAWGLGAMLYAAVEGRPPFDRGKPIATLTAVVSDPVPPHPHTGPLAPIIDELLAKDPGRRMTLSRAQQLLSEVAGGAIFIPAPAAPLVTAAPFPAAPAVAGPGTAANPFVATASSIPAESASSSQGPGGASLPPPPWAAQGSFGLAPLPNTAAPKARGPLILVALLVGFAAALVGYAIVAGLAGWT